MELVVDANILMSALISIEGKTFDIIFNDRIKLFSSDYILEECEEHKDEILAKSNISKPDFELFLSLISLNIELIPKAEFSKYVSRAGEITPDPDDTEYFALALKLNCPIWSNDKRLRRQKNVKVYSTEEIIKKLK